MRSSSIALAALVAATVFSPWASAQNAVPPGPHEIIAVITGLRNDNGKILLSLYDGPGRWPEDGGGVLTCQPRIANRRATCRLSPAVPGTTYAIGFAHDENDNGHVDFGVLGIPTEGYGFSNNARPRLSAPSFRRCQFTFAGGSHTVTMHAQY
jgi:uncharacterized protein (DUF2141 family)